MINSCIADYRRQAAEAEAKIQQYEKTLVALGVVEKVGEYAGDAALILSGLEVYTAAAGATKVVLLRAAGKPVAKKVVQATIRQVTAKSDEFAKELLKDQTMKFGAEKAADKLSGGK